MFDDLNEEIVNSLVNYRSQGFICACRLLNHEFEGEWHWRSEYIK